MPAPSVVVRGLDELRTAMRALPPELQRELPRALRRGARPAQLAAKAAAPAARGRLRSSVGIRTNRWGAAVGSPLVHAPIIAFGRVARVPAGRVRAHVRHLTPRDWIVGPVEATAPLVETEAGAAIQSLLDRVVGTTSRVG